MSVDEDFSAMLKRLADGETLGARAAARAFAAIMAGRESETRMAAFLTALTVRKPTVEEVAGGAEAMREAMRVVNAPPGAIDLCGTGGDGKGTLNISTATAFVVAACGVPVAKHGNRSASSRTGTADVLEVLGVKIGLEPKGAELCLKEAGLCFMFAPTHHTAMKFVAPVRKELAFRTVFNLLGPICNPAKVKRQLLGVYSEEWIEPVSNALAMLGAEKAWVVHGSDGLDELTTTGVTHAAILENGKVTRREISPEDAGLPRATLNDLVGGDPQHNAQAIRDLLAGAKGAFRDVVLLNAAGALMIADKTNDLKSGVKLAAVAIDSGGAKTKLELLAAASQKAA
ncbi:MAG TPA: anthranilate phosphoribosyltransferase [Rhizomicrobium sp.]|jgi:anthranilate phosphoribosyltransferase|nr:anthranilate phosphoribosyltransferase [Rhizomicrobium sp.]